MSPPFIRPDNVRLYTTITGVLQEKIKLFKLFCIIIYVTNIYITYAMAARNRREVINLPIKAVRINIIMVMGRNRILLIMIFFQKTNTPFF